jgi:DNA-binding NarL/FixJ family response regulator
VRVLVVDDDPVFVEALQAMFEHDDRLEVVGTAYDGEEAVRQAEALRADAVAMDIVMPVLGGIEATRQIVAGRPDCRVVLVSGSIFQEVEGEGADVARQAGACGYVLKSRAVLELAETIVTAVRATPAG